MRHERAEPTEDLEESGRDALGGAPGDGHDVQGEDECRRRAA